LENWSKKHSLENGKTPFSTYLLAGVKGDGNGETISLENWSKKHSLENGKTPFSPFNCDVGCIEVTAVQNWKW